MISIKKKDFTYYKYKELIKAISIKGIKVFTVYNWYKENPKKGLLIRHDIDRWAENSLDIATLENDFNIKTTYYFRKTKDSFKPNIINEIARLGHEIGYHYEDLSLANGNFEKAKELFSFHLSRLREIADVKTCAMHGRPFSKYDNRDLWGKFQLKDFDLDSEAFLSIDYSDTYYFTDTGRSWAENSANLRDKVKTNKIADISSTNELIEFIYNNPDEKIALVVHTERWPKSYYGYVKSKITDGVINIAKGMLSKN
jgi:hypothetical protein